MFGDPQEIKAGGTYKICFVGKLNPVQEEMLTLFKAARLLHKSEFKQDKDVVLQTVEKLNEECDGLLMKEVECRTIRSCTAVDIEPRNNTSDSGKVCCEDPRLSINVEGLCYKALYIPEGTEPLTEYQTMKLFEQLAGCYDLSGIKPRSSTKTKYDAWKKATAMGQQQRAKERRAQMEVWTD